MTFATEEGPAGTRAVILQAAEVLFGERGFSKTTLDDVAAAADVSRPLIYRYFGDKSGLFAVVVDRVLREWNEVLAAEVARTTPGTEHTLRLVLEACLEFARTRTVLRGLLMRDSRLAASRVGAVLEEGRERLPALIQEVLEEGIRRREVRSDLDPSDMAHVVSELFVSYTLRVLSGDDEQVGQRRVAAVIETLLHGVIAARA